MQRINSKVLLDVVLGKQIIYNDDDGKSFEITDISEEHLETYTKLRETLAEKAAESSDELIEKFLEEGDLTNDELIQGIRALTIKNEIVPVCVVQLLKIKVFNLLLDCVDWFLPSPIRYA